VYQDLLVYPDMDPMVEMPLNCEEVCWGLQAVLNYKSAGICDIKGEMLRKAALT
jgi:hypothetical protein